MKDTHVYILIMISISGMIIIAALYNANAHESLITPTIPEELQRSCGTCLSENYNLSFETPVEAFYWLEVNEQRKPEIIVMKYAIALRCGYNCTIWNREEEEKMVDRVILIHNLNGL